MIIDLEIGTLKFKKSIYSQALYNKLSLILHSIVLNRCRTIISIGYIYQFQKQLATKSIIHDHEMEVFHLDLQVLNIPNGQN